jgi:hypothetical protein
MRNGVVLALLILLTRSTAASGVDRRSAACPLPSEAVPEALGHELAGRTYRVTLVATSGVKQPISSVGHLTLRPTSVSDRSQRTGELAKDKNLAWTPFYGWLDADLSQIKAPICDDAPHPSASSQDPVYPGVLVARFPWRSSQRAPNVPMILVASVGNLRNGDDWTDGCGFAMYLKVWSDGCFRGTWERYGLRLGGSGHFCLCE